MVNLPNFPASVLATSPTHLDRLALLSLIAGVAIIGANSLALGPIAPGIATDLDDTIINVLYGSAAFGIGTALSAFTVAPQIDRLGAARSMVLALAVLTLSLLASGLSPSTGWLVISQGVAGLAAGLGLPAIYSLAALIAPSGKASSVLGYVLIGWTLSMGGGVALSALVADLVHWRAVYGSLAIIGALVSVFGTRLCKYDEPSSGGAPSAWRSLRVPGVLPMLSICFAYMAAFYGTYGYIGDHVFGHLGLPIRATALIAISYGLGFGFAAAADRAIDRFGSSRLMPMSFALIGAIYAMIATFADSYNLLVLLSFAWGVANHFGLNLIVASLSAIDTRRRGTILGLNSGVTYIAMSAGTYCYGLMYEQAGFVALAICSSALCISAAAFALFLNRNANRVATG